jgi:hypothetical protein
MNQPDLITTNVDGATYTHLPGRNLAADLKKAQRKWSIKPRPQQTPVLPDQDYRSHNRMFISLMERTLDHYRTKAMTLADPMHVLIITLFKPTKPQCFKFNREIESWARSSPHQHQIHIRYVNPVDWGLT